MVKNCNEVDNQKSAHVKCLIYPYENIKIVKIMLQTFTLKKIILHVSVIKFGDRQMKIIIINTSCKNSDRSTCNSLNKELLAYIAHSVASPSSSLHVNMADVITKDQQNWS